MTHGAAAYPAGGPRRTRGKASGTVSIITAANGTAPYPAGGPGRTRRYGESSAPFRGFLGPAFPGAGFEGVSFGNVSFDDAIFGDAILGDGNLGNGSPGCAGFNGVISGGVGSVIFGCAGFDGVSFSGVISGSAIPGDGSPGSIIFDGVISDGAGNKGAARGGFGRTIGIFSAGAGKAGYGTFGNRGHGGACNRFLFIRSVAFGRYPGGGGGRMNHHFWLRFPGRAGPLGGFLLNYNDLARGRFPPDVSLTPSTGSGPRRAIPLALSTLNKFRLWFLGVLHFLSHIPPFTRVPLRPALRTGRFIPHLPRIQNSSRYHNSGRQSYLRLS
jgi:hypothetical protein